MKSLCGKAGNRHRAIFCTHKRGIDSVMCSAAIPLNADPGIYSGFRRPSCFICVATGAKILAASSDVAGRSISGSYLMQSGALPDALHDQQFC